MIKTMFLITGLTLLGPGTGGVTLSNPVQNASFQISHLELSMDETGVNAALVKDAVSGFKVKLQSEKTIEVRF